MGEYDNLGFDELKNQLVQTIEEQKQIEEKLQSLKQAISVRLKEVESIRDSLDDNQKTIDWSVVNKKIADKTGEITINLKAIWQFFLSYIVPILIIAAIFGFAAKFVKANYFTDHQTTEQGITAIENMGDNWYEIG